MIGTSNFVDFILDGVQKVNRRGQRGQRGQRFDSRVLDFSFAFFSLSLFFMQASGAPTGQFESYPVIPSHCSHDNHRMIARLAKYLTRLSFNHQHFTLLSISQLSTYPFQRPA